MPVESYNPRRRFLKSTAALAAVPYLLRFAAAHAADDVKVGFVLPLTGPFAEAGQLQKAAVDMAIEEINAAGGVKCLGGAKLVPLYGSYQTDAAEANVETERLISKEKVVGIIGPYASGVAIAGTEIAERAKVPYLVPNALSDAITSRGLKYTFKSVPHVSQFAIDGATVVQELSKAAKIEPKIACLVRADDYFGNVVGEQFRNHLPKFGFQISSDNTYPNNATSMEDVILKLKGDDPDVVFAAGEPAAITLLFQQLKELDYWPKLGWIGVGGGYSNPVTHKNLGDLANGLIVVNDWFPDIKRPGAKEANERFKKRTGVDMLGNANTTYAGVWIFHAAIEKACSADPTKIRDALASLHLTEGAPMFMYPEVAFDDKGFMKFASNVAAQIQKGEAKVIWPKSLAVADATWPVAGWGKRK
ncbi:MAG: ABC transporter substrate-binding protein [Gammaproteobacteria bacterium]